MRVLRGRPASVHDDREVSDSAVQEVAESGTPLLRVWQPHEHVAFGRRDSNHESYDRARRIANDRGIPVVERSTGGHAVYFTGTTVSILQAMPVQEGRSGIHSRYESSIQRLQRALAALGVDAEADEPDGAFCPGTHSLSATGKIVGLAQRIRRDVAVVGGIVVVRDHEAIADVLEPIYETLDITFAREATGSIARAGGDASPDTVLSTLEDCLADEDAAIERV